ncbi:hypothetical protein [Candidatus Methanomethylophilus sp. 1R26]|uniref:hypothetical protein n=1 Tax=Candidatus Methanomethylophilus sp. 1R26 TaxID=1769296 RepID=UPI001F249E1D|nr:hypothetical protein [Candidatus Methanomethylophilus sp. 1R26]
MDVSYSPSPESVRTIRRKMDRQKLSETEIRAVVNDIYSGSLSNIEISSWLTALYINGMDIDEIAAFARAMVDTGDVIRFDKGPVYDFHSMGGVPGNKITPIVVSICAAAGLMIPKTSSRAISSACGTSDFVETFCNIEVSAEKLKEIGETVGGAFVWGGAMNIAPVDDIVIKVEHPLGINPRAQMLASILSKKLAIGAKYLLVDIPTGAGTKVPTLDDARAYARDFMDLGEKLGMHIECAITYGDQPVAPPSAPTWRPGSAYASWRARSIPRPSSRRRANAPASCWRWQGSRTGRRRRPSCSGAGRPTRSSWRSSRPRAAGPT